MSCFLASGGTALPSYFLWNCSSRSLSIPFTSPVTPLISLYKAHPFLTAATAPLASANRVIGSITVNLSC